MLKRSFCATLLLLTAAACGGSEDDVTTTEAGTTATTDTSNGGNASSGGSTSSGSGTTGDDSTSDTSSTTGAGGDTSTSDTTSTTGETDSITDPIVASDPAECGVWLATDGDDANDGSESLPVLTLAAAYELICPEPPAGTPNGQECLGEGPRTICVKPGTYELTERFEFRKTRMGTEDNRITLQGDPASSEKPVFDFSGQERLTCGANPDNIGGLTINAHYVTVRDLAVTGANDNCILVQGYQGLVENVLVYACADTGIQISSGGMYENSGRYNKIVNCDSHSNHDEQCDGENADGFAVKVGTGPGNEFIGCRAWNNSSDGFDLFAWTSPVRVAHSWAFDQCATTGQMTVNCDGFKLGGNDIEAAHELADLIAVGNSRGTGNGFTENTNPASMTCSGTCAAWGNTVDVGAIGGVGTEAIDTATVDSMAADSARDADGNLKLISEL
jgi:hypothetical protein